MDERPVLHVLVVHPRRTRQAVPQVLQVGADAAQGVQAGTQLEIVLPGGGPAEAQKVRSAGGCAVDRDVGQRTEEAGAVLDKLERLEPALEDGRLAGTLWKKGV